MTYTLRMIRHLPIALTALRALLAPVVVLLAVSYPNRTLFGICLIAAFLSDIFDGILARRLQVATPNLRRLDSIADSIFYAAATFAVWHLEPSAITAHATGLVILGALEMSRYILDLWKFKREASYHMWSSKLWGIALFAGFFSLLALGTAGLAVTAAIYLGILADMEGLAISIVLPEWKTDVPTIIHAFRLRTTAYR
jgi:phosphatidylglycerophosphate synthase